MGHLTPWHSVLLIMCASVLLTASVFAIPAEEIAQAVAVNSGSDVSGASPKQFLKAFIAVALRARPRELPDYVTAAIDLRPELAPNIVAVAIKAAVKNSEAKPGALYGTVDRIIRAAIVAKPDAMLAIIKAGASASPESRHIVISAAISAAPDEKGDIIQAAAAKTQPFGFLTFAATESSGFPFSAATLNPANIFDLTDSDGVTSPEQPPSH
jgi:hypothetical protein